MASHARFLQLVLQLTDLAIGIGLASLQTMLQTNNLNFIFSSCCQSNGFGGGNLKIPSFCFEQNGCHGLWWLGKEACSPLIIGDPNFRFKIPPLGGECLQISQFCAFVPHVKAIKATWWLIIALDYGLLYTWTGYWIIIFLNSILAKWAKYGFSIICIWIFTKFGGCSSKTEPATLISILNFKWAWQA